MKAVAAIFDILPGWVYAALIAALMLGNCGMHTRMKMAETAKAEAKSALDGALLRHEKALGAETAAVLQLERELATNKAELEKRDAEHGKVVDRLREDLRRKSRAGGGSGLRDPHAPACSGSAAGAPAAGAGHRADDTGEAGGLLSVPLEQLLLELQHEADTINRAYAACRQDAFDVRLKLNQQLSPPTVAGPASPGQP